jgi:hypothetical protein
MDTAAIQIVKGHFWNWQTECANTNIREQPPLPGRSGGGVRSGSAAGKSFRQPDELPDFSDFLLKGFLREFLPHLRFQERFMPAPTPCLGATGRNFHTPAAKTEKAQVYLL